MRKYLIVIEETPTGRTCEEVERNMREAIEFHLDGLRLEGLEVPAPHT